MTATINFSNGTSLKIKESDYFYPIVVKNNDDGKPEACRWEPIELYDHVHNGLIPSIMTAMCTCDFFYINGDIDIVYGTKSIVSVVSD